ncbi:GreA/GreB family elongation factor [Stutzerimonas azotifigens]|uniref:GreA/GreB family elongation factor n=1 Tax=Stutzerimonas azotifigens TaxID=291995 RepID=UPI000489AE64|nr:GreA/GreB family elongation factor [Stutzerimonas azotifigens]
MGNAAVRQRVMQRLEDDLRIARAVLQATHEAATHSESKAENKYDTRGLEAAYLADGQRRRLHEIELALAAFRNLPAEVRPEGVVRMGALVQLAQEESERWVFFGPDGAGLKVMLDGQEVLVISPRSPLGQALPGREIGDEVQIRVAGRVQTFEVLDIR